MFSKSLNFSLNFYLSYVYWSKDMKLRSKSWSINFVNIAFYYVKLNIFFLFTSLSEMKEKKPICGQESFFKCKIWAHNTKFYFQLYFLGNLDFKLVSFYVSQNTLVTAMWFFLFFIHNAFRGYKLCMGIFFNYKVFFFKYYYR